METRKLQRVGGGTYTVSLPKEWATDAALEAGAEVYLYSHGDGSIVVRDTRRDRDALANARVEVDGDGPELAARGVRAAYVAGFDCVAVPSASLTDRQRREVRSLVETLVGVELVADTGSELRAQSLLDPEDVSVRQTVDRLRFVARAAHTRGAEALRTGEDVVERVREREVEARRLTEMVTRHFGRSLVSLAEVDRLGTERATLFDHAETARHLERVAAAGTRLAAAAASLPGPPDGDRADELLAVAADARNVVDDAASIVLEGAGVETAHDVLDARAAVAEDAAALRDRAADGPTGRAVARVADDVERTADCGASIAAVALRADVRRREL